MGKNRSIKSKPKSAKSRRAEKRLEQRTRMLIVGEGSKTEPYYFQELCHHLRLSSADVEVVGRGEAPISVISRAIELHGKNGYEEVWCVFDVEAPKAPTLGEALKLALTEPIIAVVLTNPCFEYWYIIHFKKISPGFNKNEQCYAKLELYWPGYDKGSGGHHEFLKDRTDFAISTAEQIAKEKLWGPDLTQHNPSTHVHRLVKRLQKMAAFK